jgi:hypothetical protein
MTVDSVHGLLSVAPDMVSLYNPADTNPVGLVLASTPLIAVLKSSSVPPPLKPLFKAIESTEGRYSSFHDMAAWLNRVPSDMLLKLSNFMMRMNEIKSYANSDVFVVTTAEVALLARLGTTAFQEKFLEEFPEPTCDLKEVHTFFAKEFRPFKSSANARFEGSAFIIGSDGSK